MRIQILPLPAVTLGDATHVPFIVVLDHLQEPLAMAETAHFRRLVEAWGARGLVAAGPGEAIEVAPELELPDDLKRSLLDLLDAPTPPGDPMNTRPTTAKPGEASQ